MDKIESLYKDAFSQIKPVAADAILNQLEGKLDAKPTRFKTKTFVVLIAACFLLLSSAVVAAAQAIANRSGIERLAEIIGEEEAAELQHLGISNIPDESAVIIYDSFIIPNEMDNTCEDSGEADRDAIICPLYNIPDDIYRVDSMITDDGVRVELIAVGVGYDYIDMYLLLEDLVGSRFVHEDWFTVNHYLRFTDATPWGHVWGHGLPIHRQEVIGRDIDAGIVLLHSRLTRPRHHAHDTHINPRNLTFNISNIAHNFDFAGYHEVDVSLEALMANPSPLRTVASSANISASPHLFDPLFQIESILSPHTIDYRFEIEGLPMYISAIGVIDGRLHIQTYTPGGYDITSMYLQRPCGEKVESYGSVHFRLDEDGNLAQTIAVNDEGNIVWHGEHQYSEHIFKVDADNLEGYSLIGYFRAVDIIGLNWAVSFELQGGIDAAAPIVPPQLAQRPAPPDMIELMADPIISDMIGAGMRITVELFEGEVWRYFTDAHGVITFEEDFDTLPPLLAEYLWYRFWGMEFGR